MNNLRIVYSNSADTATITASTTAGGLVASNLVTDYKSEVWRSSSTSATLTATWATAQMLGVVSLPFCNFTSTATMRVRGYTEATDSSPFFDTTALLCCAYSPLGQWDWGAQPLGVNAFSYAGGAYATVWFTIAAVKKIVVDLVDTANTAGYLEAGRLVTGSYWSPSLNADYGASVSPVDSTKVERTDAGDPIKGRGHKHRVLALNLSEMSESDRSQCYNLLLGNGLARPVLISLYPESDTPQLEQAHQLYGSLNQLGAIAVPTFNRYSAPITVEEI